MKKGVAVPRNVGLCAAMANGVVAGSNASNSASRISVSNAAANIAAPPMCAIGKAMGSTSLLVAPTMPTTPAEPAIIDASVCRMPLGAAVVPEE